MAKLTRHDAREQVFNMVFESILRPEVSAESIYVHAVESRDLPNMDYIKRTFFGVCENAPMLDEVIEKYASGWRSVRISPVLLSAMRIAIYEMFTDVPCVVAINEAIELSKKFDEPKMKNFVNGILNAVKDAKEKGELTLDVKTATVPAFDATTEEKAEETAEGNPDAETEV